MCTSGELINHRAPIESRLVAAIVAVFRHRGPRRVGEVTTPSGVTFRDLGDFAFVIGRPNEPIPRVDRFPGVSACVRVVAWRTGNVIPRVIIVACNTRGFIR